MAAEHVGSGSDLCAANLVGTDDVPPAEDDDYGNESADEGHDDGYAALHRLDQLELPVWSRPVLGNDEYRPDCSAVVDVSW